MARFDREIEQEGERLTGTKFDRISRRGPELRIAQTLEVVVRRHVREP
jgi:hypothetical protein